MPNWSEVLKEIEQRDNRAMAAARRRPSSSDKVRRRYLKKLHEYTGRNVISYYSGWLMRSENPEIASVVDADKNGFMSAVHGLDCDQGLDLILHTPGGDIAATESLVHYLRQMFGSNMRAVVPQLAMSAGTMIACACASILLGKQSNLGPTDPQIRGVPASGVLREFEDAIEEAKKDPVAGQMWAHIIQKYHPTFLQTCQRAVKWSHQITQQWLETGMFEDETGSAAKAREIAAQLADTDATFNHARHIHLDQLEGMGLKIQRMEDDDTLQDLVLTIHHAYMHTFSSTNAVKIIENHNGVASIVTAALSPP